MKRHILLILTLSLVVNSLLLAANEKDSDNYTLVMTNFYRSEVTFVQQHGVVFTWSKLNNMKMFNVSSSGRYLLETRNGKWFVGSAQHPEQQQEITAPKLVSAQTTKNVQETHAQPEDRPSIRPIRDTSIDDIAIDHTGDNALLVESAGLNHYILLYNLNSGATTKLVQLVDTTGYDNILLPRWSPDDTKAVYYRAGRPIDDVHNGDSLRLLDLKNIIRQDNGNKITLDGIDTELAPQSYLTIYHGITTEPIWCLNGRKIIFDGSYPNKRDKDSYYSGLSIINADGKNLHPCNIGFVSEKGDVGYYIAVECGKDKVRHEYYAIAKLDNNQRIISKTIRHDIELPAISQGILSIDGKYMYEVGLKDFVVTDITNNKKYTVFPCEIDMILDLIGPY